MIAFAQLAMRVALSAAFLAVAAAPGMTETDWFDRWFDYRAHSDTVTAGAGNASRSNIAVQTVDPWPAHAARKRIDLDGKRAHKAIKRYETNTSITPSGMDTLKMQRMPNGSGDSGGK